MAPKSGPSHDQWFHHERLASPRSIRLLRLLQSSDFDSTIEAELSEADLDGQEHSFEALSYVWGSQTGTEQILCNGRLLLVTPNCESAMRHLRLKDRSRVLWIDSICIDQVATVEARLERNAQVASMGEIYSKAEKTLCWLGEGMSHTPDVMRRLEQIGICPSQRGFRNLIDFERNLRSKGMLEDDVSCLDHIFCHPWHSRIWTVQEVAFSNNCHVVCGRSSIVWDVYHKAAKFLIFEQYIDALDLQASRNMVGIDMRNVIRDYILTGECDLSSRDADADDEEALDDRDRRITFLMSCLTDVNQLKATDPKDKIYGLHALYSDLGVPLPPVDYDQPIASVYTGAALAFMSWSRSLRLLRDACSMNRDPSLPSWLPDWNDATARLYMPTTDATMRSQLGDAKVKTQSPDTGKLHVKGIVVGNVIGDSDGMMFPCPTRSSSYESTILSGSDYQVVDDVEFLRLMIDKIKFFRELFHTIEANASLFPDDDVEDIFHDMLTLGRRSFRDDLFDIWLSIMTYPNNRCDQSISRALVAKWMAADTENFAQWSPELVNCATIVVSLVSGNSIMIDGKPLSSQAEITELVKELSENLGDHAVITVQLHQTGTRTLGTTFQAVNPEDLIVLLQGADWPVVLRPSGENLAFIGPAYVVGIMDGEAWPADSGREYNMSDFMLT